MADNTPLKRETWGYVIWGLVGAVIAVFEIWSLTGKPPFPSISSTVGELEKEWSGTKAIVVALIAAALVQVATFPPLRDDFTERTAGLRRTPNGRLTKAEDGMAEEVIGAGVYTAAATAVVAVATILTWQGNAPKHVVGEVLYGGIALFLLLIPNLLAYFTKRDIPFPTLFRTVHNLEGRWHPTVLVIWPGLAVLAVHLVAYPWP
jgi:hypothetical protein